MQFWLGVAVGFLTGWIFDWFSGRRLFRKGGSSAVDAVGPPDSDAETSDDANAASPASDNANDDADSQSQSAAAE